MNSRRFTAMAPVLRRKDSTLGTAGARCCTAGFLVPLCPVRVQKPELKAACPLLAESDLVAPHGQARCFLSQMAERKCEAVNRIVSGRNFWGCHCPGDQISESRGPGGS